MSPLPNCLCDRQEQLASGSLGSDSWRTDESMFTYAQPQPVFMQSFACSEFDKAAPNPCIGLQPIFFYAVPAPAPMQPQQQSEMQYVPEMSQMEYLPQMLQMPQAPMQTWLPCADQNGQGCLELSYPPAPQQSVVEETTPGSVQILGNVWRLSRDAQGCRLVQEALENASRDDDRRELASEMHTHVWEALRCPHANFVLQKIIGVLRPQQSQFIIDEIQSKGGLKAARHRFGCRVLQRLLEHCTALQVEPLVEELLQNASALSRHVYGHYVVQHVLEHGSESQIQHLCLILISDLPLVAKDAYGVEVICTALSRAGLEEQATMVSILLSTRGLLEKMASSRYGHLAAKQAIVLANEAERQTALLQLTAREQHLKASRYGRAFARFVEKCRQGEVSSQGEVSD